MTDNELIAEFLEMKLDSLEHEEGTDYEWLNCPSGLHWAFKDVPPFNSSWSWLMPVVEKISKTPIPMCGVSFYPRTFGMQDADGNFMVRFNKHPLHTGKTLIEATHAAVVEFIKWYNQNRKQ